jgi:hypothetical protein
VHLQVKVKPKGCPLTQGTDVAGDRALNVILVSQEIR